jgi:O-succinylbenzoate synthase
MAVHLQFRRYRLPLRAALRTATEVWTEREGIIVRMENEAGRVGFGEVASIPAFGTETVNTAEAALRSLGEWPTEEQLDAVPVGLACVRHALGEAQAGLVATGPEPSTNDSGRAGTPLPARRGTESAPYLFTAAVPTDYRAVAALLPAGRAALPQLAPKLEAGFRVFKWKVGVGAAADELALLDDLCAELPKGAKLRLDANGAWQRRDAERWLERCAERPIEFIEQPCFAPKSAGDTAWRRAEDTLRGLAEDYPTPIALDESLVSDADATRWLGAGWHGWFVVKPTLLANATTVLAQLTAAKATVVFSSAIETAVGARTALEHAFRWTGENKALGFGVWPLFVDGRFDGPVVAPFIRASDLARLDPDVVWSALN